MAKEIEIKFKLQNRESVENFLNDKAKFIKESNQLDIYYNLTHRDFLADKTNVAEWLRLRKSDKGCSITYKDWGSKDNRMCDEYEENLPSIENMENIFKAINVNEMIRVDKNRKVWEYKGFTICIDRVAELGDFIEIEKVQENENDLEKITAELYALKDELGVKGEENKTGYPYDLMKQKGLM